MPPCNFVLMTRLFIVPFTNSKYYCFFYYYFCNKSVGFQMINLINLKMSFKCVTKQKQPDGGSATPSVKRLFFKPDTLLS